MLMKAFSMTTIFRKIDRHTLEAKTDDISLGTIGVNGL
jgi:hypothetical protein